MSVDSSMKNRQIWGNTVVLVPYKHLHVEKYNQWMRDTNLQYLTASEPLTLEEEYEMLVKWTNDPNKCTFIILDRVVYEETHNEVEAMIGDVNMFFCDTEDDCKSAEIEVMIAEPSSRGAGRGKESVLLMMRFGTDVIRVEKFIAKIKYDNIGSQQLFEKIGFKQYSRSEIFKEIAYSFVINNECIDTIKDKTLQMKYIL